MSQPGPAVKAAFEWFFLIAPVGLYLFVEQLFFEGHHHSSFLGSAEWGIATAFMCMSTSHVLHFETHEINVADWIVNRGLLTLFAWLMTILAIVAVLISARIVSLRGKPVTDGNDPTLLIMLQWVLFVGMTAIYLWLKTFIGRCAETKP